MFGQTAEEALDNWIASLRLAIRCVAVAEIFPTGYSISKRNFVFVVSAGDLVDNGLSLRLSRGGSRLVLRIIIDYTVKRSASGSPHREYSIEIMKYLFAVQDREGHELFAYHWHPEGERPVRYPHLHIKAKPFEVASEPGGGYSHELSFNKAHFPTGHVSLQQVIRLLIEDLGIEPRRPDWREVLTAEA